MRKLFVVASSLVISAPVITPAQANPATNPSWIELQQRAKLVEWRRGGGRPWDGRYYGGYHRYHGSNWGVTHGGPPFGTILGGALSQPYYGPYYDGHYGDLYSYPRPDGYYRSIRQYAPSVAYEGGSHVSWCYAHYRTYRAFDNTYQPYYGPRRQCVGPY